VSNRSAQMCARLRLDELDVDTDTIPAALNAALQNVPDVQFAPDLLQIDRLTLEGKSSVAADDERSGHARQVGRQVLSDAVDEIFLLRRRYWRRAERRWKGAAGRISQGIRPAQASVAPACRLRANKRGSAQRYS
jgi:hypothetical protein